MSVAGTNWCGIPVTTMGPWVPCSRCGQTTPNMYRIGGKAPPSMSEMITRAGTVARRKHTPVPAREAIGVIVCEACWDSVKASAVVREGEAE
jgi:hypothetical protein